MADENTLLLGIILAFMGWFGKEAFKKNGCIKRVEQKLDDFIAEVREHFKHK